MKRTSNYLARKIWINHFGPIPSDERGIIFEIHHKDGDPNNNDVSNLEALSIIDHLKAHINMEDWFGASLIAKRIGIELNCQTGKKRPGVGGVKPGTIPWNKGKKNCFNQVSIDKMSKSRKGRRFAKLKISDKECVDILRRYHNNEPVDDVGKIMGNGRILTYETAFCKKVSKEYDVTTQLINHIIKGKRYVKTE